MKPQENAVILARVSSKTKENEGYSLDAQEKILRAYCKTKDLRVVEVFKVAETASKQQSRTVFHHMLEFISKNQVQHLIIEKTDRFTRNFRDAVDIDDWLEADSGRMLHAVKEGLLLHKNAKSDTKFMWNILVSMSKKYTDNLREEAMKGWAEKLAQGWLPGVPPPGYKTVTSSGKRVHIPNDDTKLLVYRVFKQFLSPHTALQVDWTEGRLRELDERPLPREGAPRVRSASFRCHGRYATAHLPSSHEALESTAEDCPQAHLATRR